MTIRVLLADDHQVVRQGLRLLLESDPEIKVVGEAGDGRAAVELAQSSAPDIVIMDITMPGLNGVDATRQIIAADPQIRVIALSTHVDRRFVLAMLEAGASGYVIKTNAGEELLRAIRAAHRGQKYLSAEVAGSVVEKAVGRAPDSTGPTAAILAPREREVVQLLAEGKTSKEIAAHLHISVSTVETHRKNIMDKLNLRTVAELTKFAVREGLTSLEE